MYIDIISANESSGDAVKNKRITQRLRGQQERENTRILQETADLADQMTQFEETATESPTTTDRRFRSNIRSSRIYAPNDAHSAHGQDCESARTNAEVEPPSISDLTNSLGNSGLDGDEPAEAPATFRSAAHVSNFKDELASFRALISSERATIYQIDR